MRFIPYLTAFIFTMLYSSQLHGCICGKAIHMDAYDYIALVEVTGIMKSDLYKPPIKSSSDQPSIAPPPPQIFHEIKIKTIEQYKGRKQRFLIVHGGNNYYNMDWTSCDLDLRIGETWLLFGKSFKNKRISTRYCSASTRIYDVNNEVDYKRGHAVQLLQKVKDKYNISSASPPKNGSYELYYPHGQLKLKENYVTGKLEGKRIAYFSNGNIMLSENYNCGLKHGKVTWYHRNGTLDFVGEFSNGKPICDHNMYDNTGKHIKRIIFYDDEGNYI